MTNSDYTAICLLIDRSGSMKAIQKATEDSVNEFVAAQAARSDRTTIRIVQFDAPADGFRAEFRATGDWYLVHCLSVPAADVPPFELHPRGMTALYDAMCRAIDEFGGELGALPEAERPGTVIFAVMTDGQENASSASSLDVKLRVEHQTKTYGWQFMYLGANQDAVLEGKKIGIRANSSITYDSTDGNTRAVYESFGVAVAAASAGGEGSFTDEDRQRARSGKGGDPTRPASRP